MFQKELDFHQFKLQIHEFKVHIVSNPTEYQAKGHRINTKCTKNGANIHQFGVNLQANATDLQANGTQGSII